MVINHLRTGMILQVGPHLGYKWLVNCGDRFCPQDLELWDSGPPSSFAFFWCINGGYIAST